MSKLVQVVYASRATFVEKEADSGIEPEVARILVQSRINNPKRGLVGGLYFADGSFFQVLEGDETEVDGLLERIRVDSRHRDFKILSRRPVANRSFSTWSMKFVAPTEEVRQLLRAHQVGRFTPHEFGPVLVDQLVEVLRGTTQAAQYRETAVMALARLEIEDRFRRLEQRLGLALVLAALGLASGVIAIGIALA